MKFIHISDLHIGKWVNGYLMLEDQRFIFAQILEIIDDQKPDAILIAGDIYDKPVPSAQAVDVFDEFLVQLSQRNLQIFIISGNHDSPERIGFGARIMDKGGVHLAGAYDGKSLPVVLEDAYGPVNIFMLPFVKPAMVRKYFESNNSFPMVNTFSEEWNMASLTEDKERLPDKNAPEQEKTSRSSEHPDEPEASAQKITTYQEAVQMAIGAMDIDLSKRNILLAHQFVTGAIRSDSEERSIGGLDHVDASIFECFDYVALGHIHRPQYVGSQRIRYCGSPLKYSFSEASYDKSVTLVELFEKGNISIASIPLFPKHDMHELKGTYEELTKKSYYDHTSWQEDYIHITLTDEEDVLNAAARLQTIYHNLMKLDYDNSRTHSQQKLEDIRDMEDKSPLSIFEEFYEQQNALPMNEQQKAFMKGLIEKVWEDEE